MLSVAEMLVVGCEVELDFNLLINMLTWRRIDRKRNLKLGKVYLPEVQCGQCG